MKLALIGFFLVLGVGQARAQSVSNDFSANTEKSEHIKDETIRQRFYVNGEIYVLNGEGSRLLYRAKETREWWFGKEGDLVSHWTFEDPETGPLAIKHVWKILGNGEFEVLVQQYDSIRRQSPGSREITLGKLIKEEKFRLKDFAPINWVVQKSKDLRVAFRLTPVIDDRSESTDVEHMPMRIRDGVIFDRKGNVWAEKVELDSKYIAVRTHQGLLALSFFPFKGAKEIGFARRDRIKITGFNERKIEILSRDYIVGTDAEVKIYGLVDRNKATSDPGMVMSFASSKEKDFLKNLE